MRAHPQNLLSKSINHTLAHPWPWGQSGDTWALLTADHAASGHGELSPPTRPHDHSQNHEKTRCLTAIRAEFRWSPGVDAGGCCSPSIPPPPPLLPLPSRCCWW